jgi:hypothetical protein
LGALTCSRCRRCRRRGHPHRRHKARGFTHGSISRAASRTRSRLRPSLHGRCTFGRIVPRTPRACACRCRGGGRLLHVSVDGPCSLTLGSCSCDLKESRGEKRVKVLTRTLIFDGAAHPPHSRLGGHDAPIPKLAFWYYRAFWSYRWGERASCVRQII